MNYLPLRRNNSYTVTVTSVSGPGRETEDEALRSVPVNIEAAILPWNNTDITIVMTDGVHMLAVSQGEFNLWRDQLTDRRDDNTNVLKVFTDVQAGWSVTDITYAPGSGSGWLSTDVPGGNTGTTEVELHLLENTSGLSRTGYITIRAGQPNREIKLAVQVFHIP